MFLSRISHLSWRRKKRSRLRRPVSGGGAAGFIPPDPTADDLGDAMESFSPVTDHSLDGAVMQDDVPDIIAGKIQRHHELWYRLAYGRSRDRRVSGGFGLQPATIAGKPLSHPKQTGGRGLTHIASWKSRPKPWADGFKSPQNDGHQKISSIDYGNAEEVVLSNTQDAEDVILRGEDTLPEDAPKYMIHPYDKRKVSYILSPWIFLS